jgi:hypothetical protein
VRGFLFPMNDRYWPVAAGEKLNLVHVRTSALCRKHGVMRWRRQPELLGKRHRF